MAGTRHFLAPVLPPAYCCICTDCSDAGAWVAGNGSSAEVAGSTGVADSSVVGGCTGRSACPLNATWSSAVVIPTIHFFFSKP